jgi:hypothetical protein
VFSWSRSTTRSNREGDLRGSSSVGGFTSPGAKTPSLPRHGDRERSRKPAHSSPGGRAGRRRSGRRALPRRPPTPGRHVEQVRVDVAGDGDGAVAEQFDTTATSRAATIGDAARGGARARSVPSPLRPAPGMLTASAVGCGPFRAKASPWSTDAATDAAGHSAPVRVLAELRRE